MSEIRTCRTCGEAKPTAQFREYAPGKPRYKCRACEAPANREYVKRNKRKVREELRALRLAKEAAPESRLIGQLTQDEFAQLLDRLLNERETAQNDPVAAPPVSRGAIENLLEKSDARD